MSTNSPDVEFCSMSAERLAIGDLIRCWKCRCWHPAETGESVSNSDDDVRFVDRVVDRPGVLTCARCSGRVPLPKTEPWIVIQGGGASARAPARITIRLQRLSGFKLY